MRINAGKAVFVFDLDDTLYLESDYWHSGMRHISMLLESVLGGKAEQYLKMIYEIKGKNTFDDLCKLLKLPESTKETLIWSYRLHSPAITLAEPVRKFLDYLQSVSAGVCILTDGRLVTQRLKLRALGLLHIKNYISEEFCETKPGLKRYQLIERFYQGRQFLYIGDNLEKDFIAPNQLGWTTVGLEATEKNIHPQDITKFDGNYLPDLWIKKLENLMDFL